MSDKCLYAKTTRNEKYTVKMLESLYPTIYPYFIRIECNSGRLAGYSDHPIQYDDGLIVYDNPGMWTKEVKILVAFMFQVMGFHKWIYDDMKVKPGSVFWNSIPHHVRKFMGENLQGNCN